MFAKLHLSSPYRVVRDFLNVRVNQNVQVTDASVRKMEYCAIVGAIFYIKTRYLKCQIPEIKIISKSTSFT
jgi:hypothetical protein